VCLLSQKALPTSGRLLHLEPGALGDLGVRNVVYLARSRIENAQLIARQVKATTQCAPPRAALPGPAPRATSRRACFPALCGDSGQGRCPPTHLR